MNNLVSPKEIKRLGLNKNEEVVLKHVDLAPKKLSEIYRSCSLPHTTVYEVLVRLEVRGLVVKSNVGKNKRWHRKDSTTIEIKEKTKETLILEGREQIISTFYNLIVKSKGKRLLSFHGDKVLRGWMSLLSKKEIEQANRIIVENNIIVERYIPEGRYRKLFESLPDGWQKTMIGRSHISYFLPDELFDTSAEVVLFPNAVVLCENHLSRIVIFKNRDTVKLYDSLFEVMRRVGTKINSEEVFKKYIGKK